ncbi:MAG: DMT family transporter, partial [Alphaproteobacteria bacterium]|nr:DMT family transporter [Alphaproteobacteria bacterium]
MTITATLRLLIVMVSWSACFPLITLGLALAPDLAFAAMRAAIAGGALLLIGLLLRRPIPRSTECWLLIGVVGFGSTSLGFFGMFHTADYLSPGLATVIANAQPLLAAVLAHIFLGERLPMPAKIGLAVGLGGIIAVAWSSIIASRTPDYALGFAYIGAAALGVAIGNIAIKRLAERSDAVMAMGFQLLLGAVPLVAISSVTERWAAISWTPRFGLVLLSLSLFGTSLAFWLWFSALKTVPLSRANAFTFLVPLFGLAIGVAAFH